MVHYQLLPSDVLECRVRLILWCIYSDIACGNISNWLWFSKSLYLCCIIIVVCGEDAKCYSYCQDTINTYLS